jgi:hypothetical protein
MVLGCDTAVVSEEYGASIFGVGVEVRTACFYGTFLSKNKIVLSLPNRPQYEQLYR